MAGRRSSRGRSRRRSGYRSYSYRRPSRRSVAFPIALVAATVFAGLLGAGIYVLSRSGFTLTPTGGSATADRDRFEGIGDIAVPESDMSEYWWLSTAVEEVSVAEIPGSDLADGSGSNSGGGGDQIVQRVVLPVGITFRADSSELSANARANLEAVVADIDGSKTDITVLCHSSSDGEPDSRLRISQERADVLAALLEELLGLKEGRIVRKGLGDAFPIAGVDPTSPTGLLMNRRCEILLEL